MKPSCAFVGCILMLIGCHPHSGGSDKQQQTSGATDKHEDCVRVSGATNDEEFARRFNGVATKWARDCNSSIRCDNRFFVAQPSYRELIGFGKRAVPLIMERYSKDNWVNNVDEGHWELLLDDITGLNMIGNRNNYSPMDVRERYIEWWKKEKDRWDAKPPDSNDGDRKATRLPEH